MTEQTAPDRAWIGEALEGRKIHSKPLARLVPDENPPRPGRRRAAHRGAIGWLEMLSLNPELGHRSQAHAVKALVEFGANSSDLDCVGKAITAAARRGLDLT